MSTFDSTKCLLADLLRAITEGRIQLPDFQRGWVWDDDHVRDLLVSIARSFPVGAVMLLEAGGPVKFQIRPVEGVKLGSDSVEPDSLILDGQQRLTTLTQAVALTSPVATRTAKGIDIKRHYYFDIQKALDAPDRLEDAIVGVDETKTWNDPFKREVKLDLSSRELECIKMYFPCDQVMNSDEWEVALHKHAPAKFPTYMDFRSRVIDAFRKYQVPVIKLLKETSKEAVCLVFEKVNTGGVSLTVFELVTATYAADGYNLRDDWYGSDIRKVASREARLAEDSLLVNVDATQFLQAITLLHTYTRRKDANLGGKLGKQVRPVSAKRADVLELPLDAYRRWADKVTEGFRQAGHFLRQQCFYTERDLPYATQIVPLATVLTELGERWREQRIFDKLSRWFWCGALGELYGGAVETRIANDLDELMAWFEDDTRIPRTVTDASFQPGRLYSLRTRNSAAYRAINVLVLREGAKDFFWKMTIKELDQQGISLDIHHIFPKHWCDDAGIPVNDYDHIINKTPISYKANRKIGGKAPSEYLKQLQTDKQVQLDDMDMNAILDTHAIPTDRLRADDFKGFIEGRRRLLLGLIEKAMDKRVLEDVTKTA